MAADAARALAGPLGGRPRRRDERARNPEHLPEAGPLEPIDVLLRAAGKSAAQLARQERETAKVQEEFRFERIVGQSPAIREAIELAKSVAASSATSVLILGESGMGKELVARAIHAPARGATRPFVAVNCAALPESLLESELFGHERGAFTGRRARPRRASSRRPTAARSSSTRSARLPLALQAKLLRVLQDGEVAAASAATPRRAVDVRIVAATNRDLDDEVRRGPLPRGPLLPPAASCRSACRRCASGARTCRALARHFVRARRRGSWRSRRASSTPEALERSRATPWPGNVRELTNAMERAVLLARAEEIGPGPISLARARARERGQEITMSDLGLRIPAEGVSLVAVEKAVIEGALDPDPWQCGGSRPAPPHRPRKPAL